MENYNTGGNFTNSVRDMAGQKKLMDADTDVRTTDRMSSVIADAKAEYLANPERSREVDEIRRRAG